MFPLDTITTDHETLLRRLRWQRFLSHPLRTVKRRLGFDNQPVNWKKEITRRGRCPHHLASYLDGLPDDFFSSYSLPPESAAWIHREITRRRPHMIVECGSGLSTVAIALAVSRMAASTPAARFVSLESNDHWLNLTSDALTRLNLAPYVELSYARVTPLEFNGRLLNAYDTSILRDSIVDFLFVDGPTPDYGRAGVLPGFMGRLSDKATVVLDDACRDAERQCVELWTRECGMSFLGYVPVGHGLALFETPPWRVRQ